MAIYRGAGGAGDSNTDATLLEVTEQAVIATTKASEAAASESAASTSETNAATSATASASSAAASASSASGVAASETAAANSATAAANSATAAANSATAAATAETNAETAETNAETAETNAETAESNANTSATTATTKASEASISASNAATSASTATTKAGEAATSATNSANSATSAGNAQTAAEAARDAALAAFDSFDDRYLGPKASDPTVDNDGDALAAGMLYFNTTTDEMKVYEGSVWVNAYGNLSDALAKANNLSDLPNAATARTNLGLGTAATTASTDYATAAQGTKVDGIEAGADVTDTANVTAAGALMDSELTSIASVKALDQGVATTDSPTFAATTVTGEITANGGTLTGALTTANSVKVTGIASSNISPAVNQVELSGYGLIGNRSNLYITNADASGQIVMGIGGAHNANPKLTVTTSGLTVGGTATMDGLTVDGTIASPPIIKINNSWFGTWAAGDEIGRLQFYIADPSGAGAREVASIRSTTNQGGTTTDGTLEFWTSPYTAVAKKSMEIDGRTGDISFYEDTGTTAKFFWDASAESLGIGTTSPSVPLHVTNSASTSEILRLGSSTVTHDTGIYMRSTGTSKISWGSGGSLAFYGGGAGTTERMRITSTGVVEFKAGITEDAVTLTGTTTTINLATATNFVHDLTGATTYTFSNPATTGNATAFTLKIIQDSTARTITWPASVDWAGGTAPTLSSANNAVDVFTFFTLDGGTTYYGFTAGQAMA